MSLGPRHLCPDCSVVYYSSEGNECPACGDTPKSSLKYEKDVDKSAENKREQSYSKDYDAFDYERYGENWQKVRAEVLERDDYKCQKCGLSNEEHKKRSDLWPPWGGLHVHHLVPFVEFDSKEEANKMKNLVSLCASCHASSE